MTISARVLVAICDGRPDANGGVFEHGCLSELPLPWAVPLTRNFDRREPPLGVAHLTVTGDQVFAEFAFWRTVDRARLQGLYPALGGQARASSADAEGRHIVVTFEPHEVSLCDGPNADPRIPPLTFSGPDEGAG